MLVSSAADALCLTAPAPRLLALQRLIDVDPVTALTTIRHQIDFAGRAARIDTHDMAWLRAIEAAALSALERNDEELAAATKGLQLALAPDDPARLELLVQHANGLSAPAEIARGIELIDEARKLQPRGSIADICALSELGLLEHFLDHSERATAILLAAYRAADKAGLASQRAAIASNFAAVLRRSGDVDQSLALNAQEIEWTRSNGLTYGLANAYFFRGQALVTKAAWADALTVFERSRALARTLGDPQGIAFADMGICEALLGVERPTEASAACAAAEQAFSTDDSNSMNKIRWLKARIALDGGQPLVALKLLDEVLDSGSVALSSAIITDAFGTRAAVYAALGNFRAAYGDLLHAADRRAQANAAARSRESAIMRARFVLDVQLQQNAALQRELRLVEDRAREERYQVVAVLAGATSIIALLGYIVLNNRHHRRALMRLADDDLLTGLPNRRRLTQVMHTAIDEAADLAAPLSIALLDLDHFKAVNDNHGHAAGDDVLQSFAAAARGVLRPGDSIGRWGGEEFLLIFPATVAANAQRIVERIREVSGDLRLPVADDIRVSFSAGITMSPDGRMSLEEMMQAADSALYVAKQSGRNRSSVA